MKDPTSSDELERRLAELPEEVPGLDPEAARRFRKARRRIHRHHVAWRDGMPTLDSLFDDDSHRARALAGSLCTELEDVLVAWGSARAKAGRPDAAAREFVRATAEAWRERAVGMARGREWGVEAREVFEGVLDDLVARARARGEAALAGEARADPLPARPWQVRLRRILRVPVVLIRRFLRPDTR